MMSLQPATTRCQYPHTYIHQLQTIRPRCFLHPLGRQWIAKSHPSPYFKMAFAVLLISFCLFQYIRNFQSLSLSRRNSFGGPNQ